MAYEEDIVILGGGPAGAFCAFELACRGIKATIFDHSHPREKPCGGAISLKAIEKFPFLEEFRSKGCTPKAFKIISCINRETNVAASKIGFNLSRQYLDEQILRMAIKAGAGFAQEKILAIEKINESWQIKTNKRSLNSRIIIGADGVNSILRKKTISDFSSEDLGLAYGYFVTGVEEKITTIKFLAEIPGYIWVIPRCSNTCIGIVSELRYGSLFREILDDFLCSFYPKTTLTSKYAAMLPWATNPDFFIQSCSGNNWVLIGDAAGHTDPLTGEGILYALWSGKLAAEALAKNDLPSYDQLWHSLYGDYLRDRCRQKKNYYNPLVIEISIAKQSLIQLGDFF